jgi:hypothetical protein
MATKKETKKTAVKQPEKKAADKKAAALENARKKLMELKEC